MSPAPRTTAADRLRRVLALVPWVAARNGPTVRDTCAAFGLTSAQLLADVELLSVVGVPPYTPDELFEVAIEDGRVWVHGSPSFRRAPRLTPDEALAVVAAGAGLRSGDGDGGDGRGGPLDRALAKVAHTLGIEPDEVVEVEVGRARPGVLEPLRRAVATHHRVRLDYHSWNRDDRARREVDPAVLWTDQGWWYLAGHDHLRGERRVFRLDRVVGVEVLDTTFAPPAEADPVAFAPGDDAPQVTLELAPEARWVVELHPAHDVVELPDGGLRATLAVTARPWFERLLVRLGPAARVVATAGDPSLAGAGAAAARRILARYETAGARLPSPPL